MLASWSARGWVCDLFRKLCDLISVKGTRKTGKLVFWFLGWGKFDGNCWVFSGFLQENLGGLEGGNWLFSFLEILFEVSFGKKKKKK